MNIISPTILASNFYRRRFWLGLGWLALAFWFSHTPAHAADGFAPGLLAQASLDGAIDKFTAFLAKILLLIALVLVIWAGFLLSQGKVQEALFGLIGAFVLACAGLIVRHLVSIAGS